MSADIPGSAEVCRETQSVSHSDPKSLTRTVNLSIGPPQITMDKAQATIAGSLNDIGPNYGLGPLSLQNATQTYFGGLILFDSTSATPILKACQCSELGTCVDSQTFPYQNNTESETIEILGSWSTTLASALPALAKIGVTADGSHVYKVKYTLTNRGKVVKPEKAGFSLDNAVPTATLAAIGDLMSKNPKAILIYVNTVWAVQSALFQKDAASALAVGATADAGSVFAGNAVWKYSNNYDAGSTFMGEVLNLWGYPVTLSKTVTSTGGPPAGGIKTGVVFGHDGDSRPQVKTTYHLRLDEDSPVVLPKETWALFK